MPHSALCRSFALRICFQLTSALETAYAGVPKLGEALRVDAHAVSVFVEAELRASVLRRGENPVTIGHFEAF